MQADFDEAEEEAETDADGGAGMDLGGDEAEAVLPGPPLPPVAVPMGTPVSSEASPPEMVAQTASVASVAIPQSTASVASVVSPQSTASVASVASPQSMVTQTAPVVVVAAVSKPAVTTIGGTDASGDA